MKLAESYIGDSSEYAAGANNALLHPALCDDEELRHFPRTDIVCGGLDPLLDDAVGE